MSTHSKIGIELPDGKVKSMYCHFDGYPDGVGHILNEHYTSEGQINRVIDLASIRSLRPLVEECKYLDIEEGEEPDIHESVNDYFSDWSWGGPYIYMYTQEGEWLVKYEYDDLQPMKIDDYRMHRINHPEEYE